MVNKWIINNLFRFFSPPCLLCGASSDRAERQAVSLCRACRHDLPFTLPHQVCRLCALPLEGSMAGAQRICGKCLRSPPPWSSCISTFHYRDPVASLIQALKFNGQLSCAVVLGGIMAHALSRRVQVLPDLVIPVPLHRLRLRERGYNQSYELALPVAGKLGIPLDRRACHRTRQTGIQSLLPAQQRRHNMGGAFEFKRPPGVRHVAVIDDVMTTSSTVQSLCTTLLQEGVEKVDVWVCARASAPGCEQPRNPF